MTVDRKWRPTVCRLRSSFSTTLATSVKCRSLGGASGAHSSAAGSPRRAGEQAPVGALTPPVCAYVRNPSTFLAADAGHSAQAANLIGMNDSALLPRVFLRPTVIEQGISSDEIERRRRSKEWFTLRPGAYVNRAAFIQLELQQRHLVLIHATLPVLTEDAVLSHITAACAWGIETWGVNLRAVQVTRAGTSGGHRRLALHTFRAQLADDEVVLLDGMRVTSVARTLVDLARILPFEQAVVAADSALHLRLVTRSELDQALTDGFRRPGLSKARQVFALADSRAESVGESRSRAAIAQSDLPMPDLQVVIRNSLGAALGRGDFVWRRYRTVGEFDGAKKYRPNTESDQNTLGQQDALYLEKLREDNIRAEGWHVIRWGWKDLDDPTALVQRIWCGLQLGRQLIRH